MEFRIADTFTDSLSRLTAQEQKAVKTTAFDLQLDPSAPGLKFHKLAQAKDRNFWSVRVNDDLRLIVHRTEAGLLLCYVGHHDDAYRWAERRKIEQHPKTGAAQIVLLRERIEELLKTLTFREREIIRLRYGLADGYSYTLEEVGRIFKVTRERVRQIEAKAVAKLQNPVRSKYLEPFVPGVTAAAA